MQQEAQQAQRREKNEQQQLKIKEWQELLEAIAAKYPDMSKSKRRQQRLVMPYVFAPTLERMVREGGNGSFSSGRQPGKG